MEKWEIIILFVGALYNEVFCSLPRPDNVTFTSVNLRNVLQWQPGNDTSQNTHFTVQYAIYGDTDKSSGGRRLRWRGVQQCRDLHLTWCDLTNQTWDLEQCYYARVRAVGKTGVSKWTLTQRFDPKSDTTLGPPSVSVAMEDNNAIISIKAPLRYQPANPEVSMVKVYPQMTFNLSVRITYSNLTLHFPLVSSRYVYRLMEYETQYCFSAKSRFISIPVICQPSEWHCINTPEDPVMHQLRSVVVAIVVPSLCMCMLGLVGYFIYHSLWGRKQTWPHILKLTPQHFPLLTFPPENLNIIVVALKTNNNPPPICNTDCSSCKPPSYAPQGPALPPEHDAHWENGQETEAVDYGFVACVQVMGVEVDGVEQREGLRDEGALDESWEPRGVGMTGAVRAGREDRVSERAGKRGDWDQTTEVNHSPYISQNATPMQTCALTQTHTHKQVETGALSQIRLLLRKGEKEGGCSWQKEDSGAACLSPVLKSPPTRGQGGKERGMEGTDGRTDGGLEERGEMEQTPRVSAYTGQYDTSITQRCDYLSNHYGIIRCATEQEMAEGEEEEEAEANRVNWDPESRVLDGGLDEWMQEERETESQRWGEKMQESRMGVGGETGREGVRLETVFVRQGSEQEEEAEREVEGVWEADDLLTNWKLVVHMDE